MEFIRTKERTNQIEDHKQIFVLFSEQFVSFLLTLPLPPP